MKIHKIDSAEKFDDMELYWNQVLLRSGSAHIHSTFEWLSTWWKFFGTDKRLFILVAEEDDGIIGIAPLMIEYVTKIYKNIMPLRRISFLGAGFTDSADFIICKKREEVLREFFNYIGNNDNIWDEIELRQIPSNSPNHIYLSSEKIFAGRYDSIMAESIRAPYLVIDKDFNTYLNSLGKSWRRDLSKNVNKLIREKPEISFKAVERIDDELLNNIYKLTLDRNRKTGWKSMFLDTLKYAYLKEIIPLLEQKGYVKIFLMLSEADVIAYQLAFKYDNVLYFWNTSYLPEYGRYSIGTVLHYYTLKYTFENGFAEADFMVGEEDYKYHWTSTQSTNHIFHLEKRNIKVKINRIAPKLKNWAKARIK